MLPHWKHLLLGQRKSIANMLAQGWRLKKIASVIGMDPTSISKEIERNRTMFASGPDCPKTNRFPFVCDNCPLRYQKSKCRCARWRYVAADAQAKADRRLTQSRAGVDATEEEFKAIDEAVKKGVAQGKSIYAISRLAPVAGIASQSTLYSWIASGKMTTKRADLPKAVKYKKRAKNKYDYKGSSNVGKEGRKYLDYIAMRRANPGLYGAQMDFLGSVVAAKTAIFVLVIPELHYAIGKRLPKGDGKAVAAFFDDLESAIGTDAFAKVFPFILTDNDPCFSDFEAIEFSAETGEKRTTVYFCDPYVSNQKASVENINGQLRRYFSKKRNVDEYTDEYVAQSFDNINSAPLKSLGGETPKAAMRAVFGDEIARAIEEFIKG